jgi:hypothetical protein
MVEPSDPSYKQRKESTSDGNHYGPTPSLSHESASHALNATDTAITTTDGNTATVKATECHGIDDDGNDDDNLDDFFASLE